MVGGNQQVALQSVSTCVRLAVTRSRIITFHFSADREQQWCVSISGCRRTEPDMLGTTRRSEDNVGWRRWRWSGVLWRTKSGAQNIWWWRAALSARAGPEPVKASSFALGRLMPLATPTRAGYAGNSVPGLMLDHAYREIGRGTAACRLRLPWLPLATLLTGSELKTRDQSRDRDQLFYCQAVSSHFLLLYPPSSRQPTGSTCQAR